MRLAVPLPSSDGFSHCRQVPRSVWGPLRVAGAVVFGSCLHLTSAARRRRLCWPVQWLVSVAVLRRFA